MHLRLGQAARHDAQIKHRGLPGVATDFMLNLIAYNLIRIPKLLTAAVSVCSQHPDRPKTRGKKTANAPISRFFSRPLEDPKNSVRPIGDVLSLMNVCSGVTNCPKRASSARPFVCQFRTSGSSPAAGSERANSAVSEAHLIE